MQTEPKTSNVKPKKNCRLCGLTSREALFSLGSTPLANEFVPASQKDNPQELFPLDVVQCKGCGHVQLAHVVNPERLFRNYVYVSGTSPKFVDHFRRYAEAMLALTGMKPGSTVLEIGSNDGTLLRFFKDADMDVLGIDPAENIAAETTQRGIPTRAEFFTSALARQWALGGKRAALVVANNVYAHADDLEDIALGVRTVLEPNGLFVFEVSYLLDVFEQRLFDTIYHEHVSYHSLKPLVPFFRRLGMEVVDAVRVETHGGSLRVIVKKIEGRDPIAPGVSALIELEERCGLYRKESYDRYVAGLQELKRKLHGILAELKGAGKKIAGFGAPAKTTTLMYYFGIDASHVDYIVDDSPLKQGLFSPGHHIPVVASDALGKPGTRPDAVLIFAWNFADAIMAKHKAFHEAGGRFIVPIPEVQLI